MLSFPDDLLAELLKDVMYIAHLVTLELTSRTFRWTDADQAVYYNGNWYEPHPIKYDKISQDQTLEAAALKLTVSNVDKTFSDLVDTENIQDKPCSIYRILLTQNMAIVGTPTLIFYGYTDQIPIDRMNAVIDVADELIRWQTMTPRNIHGAKCRWREFKGTECAYAGAETWCDRSKARCLSLTSFEAVEGAVAEDGGVQTNETTGANNDTLNDMNIFPAVPVTGDCYYFGCATKKGLLKLKLDTPTVIQWSTTAGPPVVSGIYTIAWQYWNGAWTSLTVSDGTKSFTKGGTRYIVFNPPSDWVESTIQAITSHWVRAVITMVDAGKYTNAPKASRVWVSDGIPLLNFGGFPYAPELTDKEIWWGRVAKSWVNLASQAQQAGHL